MRALGSVLFLVLCIALPIGLAFGCARDADREAVAVPEALVGSADPGRPRVEVPRRGPYGLRSFMVPASAYWVSSGLFLRAGETATVRVSGRWKVDGIELGPEGDPSRPERGCWHGGLVARTELGLEDASLYCLGHEATITAARDGVVYFGSLAGPDLVADTYSGRDDGEGALAVTVESHGQTAPIVESTSAGSYPFEEVESGRVEVYGRHVIVATTTAQAIADRASITSGVELLDTLYERHAELRGGLPFRGQRIRFVTDDAQPGYMLAGNPTRIKSAAMSGDGFTHLFRSADPAFDVWGFAHELGHAFATPPKNWWYQVDGFVEAWPNVFSVTALQALGRGATWGDHDPTYPSAKICPEREAYLEHGTYAELMNDTHLMLCFLLELKETYGDGFYPRFFRALEATPPFTVPGEVEGRWTWLRDRFNDVVKEDTTAIFAKWHLPVR